MTSKVRFKFFLSVLFAAACLCAAAFAQESHGSTSAGNDISGKWHFVFQTEGGVREFDADFKLDGDKVSGKWGDSADVKGTYTDGKLSLEFAVNSEEAGQGTLKIEGELADNALSGTWAFQQYDGTFKATRPSKS
jgi:hypothetical protein